MCQCNARGGPNLGRTGQGRGVESRTRYREVEHSKLRYDLTGHGISGCVDGCGLAGQVMA